MSLLTSRQLCALYPHADDTMQAQCARAVELVNATAQPQDVSAHFAIAADLTMRGYTPSGQDIRRHLAGCDEVVAVACTLGADIDRLLERTRLIDLSLAYLVDQAASLAVENLAESVWRALCDKAQQQGKAGTTRYSCGYGDYALADQRAVLQLIGADKALGITVNEGGMMYPTKSITFLMGMKERGL